MTESTGPSRRALLVNAADYTDAQLDRQSCGDEWLWIDAPADWAPEQGIPFGGEQVAIVVVFAKKYEERAALSMCESIRACSQFNATPLIVAITMYQMPLGNDVKRLSNAHFVFTPVTLEQLCAKQTEIQERMER